MTPVIARVTLFGSAEISPQSQEFKAVYETARLLAQSGRTVVNGGGPGVMLAATKGARDGGGHSIAVNFTPRWATAFEGQDQENQADEEIDEPNYILRVKHLLELGQAYVIFKGGTGTLSELGMAWGLARLYYGHHKPLLLFGRFWDRILRVLEEELFIRPEARKVLHLVEEPAAVLQLLEDYEKQWRAKASLHHHPGEDDPEGKLFL